MLELSQVIIGVVDLEAATRRFRAMGFDVLDGGLHPGVGTANRVIPLGAQYVEILGVVAPPASTSRLTTRRCRSSCNGIIPSNTQARCWRITRMGRVVSAHCR